MVKNSKGGKHAKRGRNQRMDAAKRDLVLKDADQEYGQIIRSLGDRRFEVYCFDGKTRTAHVPGKFKRRLFFVRDDIVLVQLRDFQDEKTDLLHKYNLEEINTLKKLGEIPAKAGINESELLDEDGGQDLVEFTADLDDI